MAGGERSPKPQPASGVFDQLAERDLVVVSGKGGTGRTTLAAVLGAALARRGRRVLVATTGHDDRLAWMLGGERLSDRAQEVSERLFVQRLVPQTCIREYGELVLRSARLSSAVFDNRIVRRLLRAIPGLDDFAVLGKAWHEGVRGEDYDVVLLDGPATGHLLYVLGIPQAILRAIPRGPLTREAQLMQDSFEDPTRVQAVLIGLPEKWPLTELGDLGVGLTESIRMSVAAIVVNAFWPDDVPELTPPEAALDPGGKVAPVFERAALLGRIGRRHRRDTAAWCKTEVARRCGAEAILHVPWHWEGLGDAGGVQTLLQELEDSA